MNESMPESLAYSQVPGGLLGRLEQFDADLALREALLRQPPAARSELREPKVEICSPTKSLTFSGLMENPLVGKKIKS